MKPLAALVLVATAVSANAQMGPSRGLGSPPFNPAEGRTATVASSSQGAAVETEVVRVLSLTAVQNDLVLTPDQWTALNGIVKTLRGPATTEDVALSAVAKALTAAQTTRIEELMIQDLATTPSPFPTFEPP